MKRVLAVLIFALCTVFSTSTAVRAQNAPASPVDTRAVDSARAKVAGGDSAGAIHDLEIYVKKSPDDLAAARLLGDLYFRIPDYKRAEMMWRGIIDRQDALKQPEDRETHGRLGSLYSAQDRVELALIEYEKSLPTRIGFTGLVDEHRRAGSLQEFESNWARNADQHPLDAKVLSFYGNILYAQGRFAEAQPYFLRSAAIAPNNCDTLIDAGNNYIDLGKLNDALTFLERCLKIDPRNYSANVDVGEAYLEKNQSAKARTYFDAALASKPAGSEALVDIGYVEDLNGHWQEAISYYLRAMNADPLEANAYVDLGYDYNEHKLYKLAEAAFIKGISIAPTEGKLHYLLAVTYNLEGKIPLAREQYSYAIKSLEPIVVRAAKNELALLPPA
jgi:tetratricopeptide (TPR) repeat protein